VTFSLKAGTHLLLDSVHLVDSGEGVTQACQGV